MMTQTNSTRVRVASSEQAISIARRHCGAGVVFVERYAMHSWSNPARPSGQWNKVSSHHSVEIAEAAKAKLDRKIAKLQLATGKSQ